MQCHLMSLSLVETHFFQVINYNHGYGWQATVIGWHIYLIVMLSLINVCELVSYFSGVMRSEMFDKVTSRETPPVPGYQCQLSPR